MDKPKLLIIGYGRHGKDSFAEILRDECGFKFMSSSEFVGREILWDNWGCAVYNSFEEMFEDRANNRVLWMQLISAYNTPDKTKTASTMLFRDGMDMYVGMRRLDELNACRKAGIFDFIVWVQRPNLDPEIGSMDITLENSNPDFIIHNDGSLEDLKQKAIKFAKIIRAYDV